MDRGMPMQLAGDLQHGLVTLLVDSATVTYRDQPLTVITTAPSHWLRYCKSNELTILDVSGLIDSHVWQTHADQRDRLVDSLRQAGWPAAQIQVEVAVSPSEAPELSERASTQTDLARADLVLFSESQQPVAVIEIKPAPYARYFTKVKHGFSAPTSVPQVFLYDGAQLLSTQQGSDEWTALESIPSPQSLGLQPRPAVEVESPTQRSNITVLRCDSISGLGQAMSEVANGTYIIDYTIPWADRQSRFADQVRPFLPDQFHQEPRLDTLTSLLLFTAASQSCHRLIAVTPRSVVATAALASARSYLDTHLHLLGVLELPGDLFVPIAPVPSALLVLNDVQPRPGRNTAFMFLADRLNLYQLTTQTWLTEWKAGLRGEAMSIGFSAPVQDGRPWTVAAHHPDLRAAEENLARIATTLPLGELVQILRGAFHPREEVPADKGSPVVRGRDVSSPLLTKADLRCFVVDSRDATWATLRMGDILIQRISDAPKSLLINHELEGTVAGDTTFILRPIGAEPDPALVAQFLESLVGRNLLRARMTSGTGAPTLTKAALQSLPIPVLPATVATDLAGLRRLEQDLRVRADRLEAMRLGLFGSRSTNDLAKRLGEIRVTARAIAAAIGQADELDFQVRNLYPYPIAYPYRTLISCTSQRELYKEQLRVAENILSYLGSLTLALIPEDTLRASDLNLFNYWKGGISPGHWREIFQRGSRLLTADGSASRLNSTLAGLWRQPGIDAFEALIKAKNDDKHDRGPKVDDEYKTGTLAVAKLLNIVMKHLAVLTEYPPLLVTSIRLVRGSETVFLNTLRYAGDHPGLPQEEIEYHKGVPEDLYVQAQPKQLETLFPFITVHYCPHCKARETYFIDRWQPGSTALLKSFERGHVQEDGTVAERLTNLAGDESRFKD